MARINVEDSIWKDKRFLTLCIKLQSIDTALGALVRAWILAQQWYLKSPKRMVPLSEWQKQDLPKELFDCGLVIITDERWVHVAGADDQFGWLLKCVAGGEKGGKNRPKNPKTQVPEITDKNHQGTLRTPNGTLSGAKGNQTSLSSSSSSSRDPKEYGLSNNSPVLDFEALYFKYPKRDGSQRKADGMKMCVRKFRTPEAYQQLERAIDNYAAYCRREGKVGTELVSQFRTFVASVWEEWVPQTDHGSADRRKENEDTLAATRRQLDLEAEANWQSHPSTSAPAAPLPSAATGKPPHHPLVEKADEIGQQEVEAAITPEAQQAVAKFFGSNGLFREMPK